jgi:hypothetical protein
VATGKIMNRLNKYNKVQGFNDMIQYYGDAMQAIEKAVNKLVGNAGQDNLIDIIVYEQPPGYKSVNVPYTAKLAEQVLRKADPADRPSNYDELMRDP